MQGFYIKKLFLLLLFSFINGTEHTSKVSILFQEKCLKIKCQRGVRRKNPIAPNEWIAVNTSMKNRNEIEPGTFVLCNEDKTQRLEKALCKKPDKDINQWFISTDLQVYVNVHENASVNVQSEKCPEYDVMTINSVAESTCDKTKRCCLKKSAADLFGKTPCRMDYHCPNSNIYRSTKKGDVRDARYGMKYLLLFLFLLGLLAIAGNSMVVISSFMLLLRSGKHRSSKEVRAYNLLLLHLGLADFFMGIYLIGVTAGGLRYFIVTSDKWENATEQQEIDMHSWLGNSACAGLGSLNFVSSQISVSALVTITGLRLFGVCFPYKEINFRAIKVTVLFTWALWILISCVPNLTFEPFRTSFVDSIEFESNEQFPRLRYFHLRYLMNEILQAINAFCSFSGLEGYALKGRPSWDDLFNLALKLKLLGPDDLKHVAYTSYYNIHRVCATRFLVHYFNKFFIFTAAVLAVNTLSFTFIFFAQLIIAKKSFNRPSGMKSACSVFTSFFKHQADIPSHDRRELENKAMRRRMFLIVATDFMCWIPISFISIYYTYYTSKHDICVFTAYREFAEWWFYIFAMIVVPINSVINPFIYSYSTRRNLKSFFSCSKKSRDIKGSNKSTSNVSSITVIS